MIKLSKEEKDLLLSVEKGEWKSVKDLEKEKARFAKYAKNTLRKDRRINIRISSIDLDGLQAKAIKAGIPYQTFIASILHKFVSGQLAENS